MNYAQWRIIVRFMLLVLSYMESHSRTSDHKLYEELKKEIE